MKRNEELYKSKRWTEYQPVEVLKPKVKLTEEQKQQAKGFLEKIEDKMRKQDTNKK